MKEVFGREKALEMFGSGEAACFGGYFAVHRDTIRKHSVDVYDRISAQQRFILEEVMYFMSKMSRECIVRCFGFEMQQKSAIFV